MMWRALRFIFLFALVAFGTIALAPASVSTAAHAEAASAKKTTPSRKMKKMAPSEAMGIDLSVESKATEIKDGIGRKSAHSGSSVRSTKKQAVKHASTTRRKKASSRSHAKTKAKKKASLAKTHTQKNAKSTAASDVADPVKAKALALQKKGTDQALDQLDDLADHYPKSASVQAARARILTKQNDTVEALNAWQRAVSLAPNNSSYRQNLAQLKERMNREAKSSSEDE